MDPERRPESTDRRHAAQGAHKNRTRLVARQRLYDHQQPEYDLPGIVVDMLADLRGGTVLDVGCGNGRYLARLRDERPDLAAVGADSSLSALEELTENLGLSDDGAADGEQPDDDSPGDQRLGIVCADASELPVNAESVDAVLAMHMLYHVTDLEAALSEVVRVLTADGVFIAATKGEGDERELDELWASAAAEVVGGERVPERVRISDGFPLDAGADILRDYFADVEVRELEGRIEADDPDVVLPHFAAYRIWAVQSGVPFDAVLARARERLERSIADTGAFTITTRNGIIRARSPE